MSESPPGAPGGEQDAGPAGARRGLLLAAWAVAFAFLGTGVGALLVLAGAGGTLVSMALGAAAAGAVLGELGVRVERRAAANRPAVRDRRGRTVRPLGSWLLAVPLAVGLAGTALLAVVGAVYTGELAIGLGFAALAVVGAAAARPLAVRHQLGRALQAEAEGREGEARRRWAALAGAWWAPAAARGQAALNLGSLALRHGELGEAARWYQAPRAGAALPHARAGLALVRVLQGAYDEAEALLAGVAAGGRAVQGELDGVRLLLVLRRDGAHAARALGERLLSAEAGLVFLAALATARAEGGDPDGARALLDSGLREALARSGLARAVPEVATLLARAS